MLIIKTSFTVPNGTCFIETTDIKSLVFFLELKLAKETFTKSVVYYESGMELSIILSKSLTLRKTICQLVQISNGYRVIEDWLLQLNQYERCSFICYQHKSNLQRWVMLGFFI